MYSITAARPLKKLALREFCFDIHKYVFYCIFIQLISRHKRNKSRFGWHRHIWAGKNQQDGINHDGKLKASKHKPVGDGCAWAALDLNICFLLSPETTVVFLKAMKCTKRVTH